MSFPLISPMHQFFDSSGSPLVGGTLEFRNPTTNALIKSYPTADNADAQTNENANPLTLDARGGFTGLYLEDGVKYKIILKDSLGATVDTQDDVKCPIALPFDKTADEDTAGVTIVNIEYPTGNILRYGTNTTPGTTDMAAAFQAAVDVADAGGPRTIIVPEGTYLVGTPIAPTTELFGLVFQGDGSLSSIIKGSHSAGPVITVNRSNSGFRGIGIGATTARNTGSATGGTWADNVGILAEPADTAGKAIANMVWDDVRVIDQPSHGIVCIGSTLQSKFNNVLVQNNLGHGAVLDNGTINARTNKANPGQTIWNDFWAITNAGNGFVGGNPSDVEGIGAYRLVMINAEFDSNATDASVYHSQDQMWLRGENCQLITSAFGGNSVTGGLRWSGWDILIQQPRFISITDGMSIGADEVKGSTRGVVIDGARVIAAAQDPLIIIEDIDNVDDIKVTTAHSGNITSMFTAGATNAVWNRGPLMVNVRKAAEQIVNNSTTLVDDLELQVPLAINETVTFTAVIRYVSDATADFKLAVDGPSGIVVRWNNTNTIYYGAGDTVTVSNEETEGSTRAYGGATNIRTTTITGYATNSTTVGNLKVQFAQVTQAVVDTKTLNGSSLTVYRDNYQV